MLMIQKLGYHQFVSVQNHPHLVYEMGRVDIKLFVPFYFNAGRGCSVGDIFTSRYDNCGIRIYYCSYSSGIESGYSDCKGRTIDLF